MKYEPKIDHYLQKHNKEKAEQAKKLRPDPGKPVFLPKGMRGQDLFATRIPNQHNLIRGISTEEVVKMYNEGMTVGQIAKHFRVKSQTISYHLNKKNNK